MKKAYVKFNGNKWDFFLKSIVLGALAVLSFGILAPILFWWIVVYFIDHIHIEYE